MCVSPKHIKNPSKYFNPALDKKVLDVPCGHCWQCQQKKRDGLFIRSYYEWEKAKHLGGYAVFFTLTYNNTSLPHTPNLHIPCFSNKDIQDYLKRLRQRISRECEKRQYSPINGKTLEKNRLSYIYTCEYGDAHHRPHYHFIFYIQSNFPQQLFLSLAQKAWNGQGRTMSSKHSSGIINGVGALKYVTKYVTKDLASSAYLKNCADVIRCCPLTEKAIQTEIELLQPFHHESKAFGLSGIEQFLDHSQLSNFCGYKNKLNDIENIMNDKLILPDEQTTTKEYQLPLYYKRYLFYRTYVEKHLVLEDIERNIDKRTVYSPHYLLNDLGREQRILLHEKYLESCRNQFLRILKYEPKCNYGFCEFVNKHYSGLSLAYNNFKQIINDFKSLSHNISQEFLDWSFYYRGYVAFLFEDEPAFSFTTPKEDYEIRLSFNRFEQSSLDFSDEGIQYKDYFESAYANVRRITNYPYFTEFEEAYSLFTVIQDYFGYLSQQIALEIDISKHERKKYLLNV